ncbi:MAG: hypothetical protein DI598_14900 [Pseudopedobacter saltans]|uniref:ComEC/Rec2-related protein n=1 Tax=Pseudopedobacter saltans TaxID=151895 RepID=A0A2W5EQ41_9SPHI|nr:MAG: hypothetical protein DI598_14900 [Pseudopedobacter saltans]
MPAYRAIPLLRPLIALLLGILASYQYPYWSIQYIFIALAIAVVSLVAFHYFPFRFKIRLYWLSGFSILAMFFLLGYFVVRKNDSSSNPGWIGKQKDSVRLFVLVIQENPSKKTKSFLTKAETIGFYIDNQYQTVVGKTLFRIDTAIQNQYHFKDRDTVFLQTKIQPIRTYTNSNFDVATYYHRQNIEYQIHLTSENLQSLHPNKKKNIAYLLSGSQNWILHQLRRYFPNPDRLGLAEALLIGYKDDLDKNLLNAYQDAGIIHIIAISGMHLMLLYELLKWTGFLFLKKVRTRRSFQVFCLIFIWLFALLTGAGPSVIRAAVMLTFLVVGEVFYRNHNSLNSLVASAFLLLIVSPEWIWNVGFWLSYMAVLGILLFYKPILKWPDFENPIVRKIWQSISVTLGAQILTLPILMYCFGKVPLYFLFTNLLMVPLSSVILYGIIVLLAMCWNSYLASIIAKITDTLIWLMNSFVRKVSEYPLANISISIGFVQMMFLFGIISTLYYLFLKKTEEKLFM